MKERLPKIILAIILILVLGNLGFLDYQLFNQSRTKFSPPPSADLKKEPEEEGCENDCEQLIEQKISRVLTNFPTSRSITYVIPTTKAVVQTKVFYIPLISEATVNYSDWTDIIPSDFYFDLSDYPGAKGVRFEVYLKSKHQAGTVFIRLYDVSNKRAVDYSDLSSDSETFELKRSSDMSIWQGNNLYRIQAKTLNGIEGFLKEAKLKIIF